MALRDVVVLVDMVNMARHMLLYVHMIRQHPASQQLLHRLEQMVVMVVMELLILHGLLVVETVIRKF